MSGHLRETGRSIVAEEPGSDAPGRNATTYIQNLLQLHDQYTMFLEQSFENGQLFKHAIQSVSLYLVPSPLVLKYLSQVALIMRSALN